MPTENEWEQAVHRLIMLTQSGELKWQIHPQTKSQRENVEGEVYVANVHGRSIAVYEYRFQYYDEEPGTGSSGGWDTRSEVAIEFVDSSGVLQYRWPATPGRRPLLDAIQCAVSDADHFLKQLLGQPTAASQSQPIS